MYGIRVRNTGRWGYTTWCSRDGKPELYATRAEAEKVAQKYNDQQGYINRFNYYWAEEYR